MVGDAAYLVAAQVATKAVTFVLNQMYLRKITPEVFGVAAYLEFVVNSVLFFSREAQRGASQRVSVGSASQTARAVGNFACVPLLVAGPVFAVLWWSQKASDMYRLSVRPLAYFGATAACVVALVALELLAEPMFALAVFRGDMKFRSKVESAAVVGKCLLTFAGVTWWGHGDENKAVVCFAAGHVVHAAIILAGYWVHSPRWKPRRLQSGAWVPLLGLAVWRTLFVQTMFKHLLTEGDTLLISYLFSAADQGVYSLIANYGLMAARLVFQPIEESVRVSFTRELSLLAPPLEPEKKEPDSSAKDAARHTMSRLFVFYTCLSLLMVLGGYTNGAFFLHMLLGGSEKWRGSSVFWHFPHYILYVPFLAFNGVLEAFFSAALTHGQIARFSAFMSVLSAAVLGLSYLLIGRYGILGLIAANMVNMSLRIIYCLVFYLRYFHLGFPWHAIRKVAGPLLLTGAAFLAHFRLFEDGQTKLKQDFLQSIAICGVTFCGMMYMERAELLQGAKKLRKRV